MGACGCASEAAHCMTRPGVASLRCSACGCDASALTLVDVPEATKVWFDAGSVPGEPGETADVDVLRLLDDHRTAIDIAWERVTGGVCMARYVGGCWVTVKFCTPRGVSCRCECSDGTCRDGIALHELSSQVHPSRLGAVLHDALPISVNGSPSTKPWTLTTHAGYRLHGSGLPDQLILQTRAPAASFMHAVRSLACRLVAGVHTSGCSAAAAEEDGDGGSVVDGAFGDVFADALDRSCCRRLPVVAGRDSVVVWMRFGVGAPSVPVDGPVPFLFPLPTNEWTINHGLGRAVIVEMFDLNGDEIDGALTNPTLNQAVVTWVLPQTGYALVV